MEYKWTVLTVTTVGVLMAGIDGRIVVIGLPQVAAALGADAEQAIWFTQSYVLGSTIALLFIGRVSDIFGRVKVYTLGFTLFTIGSALTSLSLAPEHVIVFRMVQGLGSAVLFTNSAALITDATPVNELGLSLGINQVAYRLGSMLGLTFSGLVLTYLDWRALFYVNVPIGIFGTFWAHRRLREIATLESGAPMDWEGFATFTASISSFLLALTFAAYGSAEYPVVESLIAVSFIALVAFLLLERRTKSPQPAQDQGVHGRRRGAAAERRLLGRRPSPSQHISPANPRTPPLSSWPGAPPLRPLLLGGGSDKRPTL